MFLLSTSQIYYFKTIITKDERCLNPITLALKGNCVNHRSALLEMMLANGTSMPRGHLYLRAGPTPNPSAQTLLLKGRGNKAENHISATSFWAWAGKRAMP